MRNKCGKVFMIFGTALLIAALSLLSYNRWDAWRAEKSVENIQNIMETADNQTGVINSDDSDPKNGEMSVIIIEGNEYIGTLSIPQFGLELPVMSEWSYAGLKLAPGRFSGSVWTDDMVICGHNYERHFGNLKNLEAGDAISFTDVSGNVFNYEVAEVTKLEPTAVEEMTSGGWDLTLFTCTVGGQSRVTVRCVRMEE